MSRNAPFAYAFCGLSLTLLAQGLQSGEGGSVAPGTPHQTETLEEAKSGIETTEESKATQGAAGKAAPASPHQEQALEEPGMHFTRLDQDQDGRISKGEVKGDRDLAENWDRLDDNGDGSLSPEEFAKFSRQAPNL